MVTALVTLTPENMDGRCDQPFFDEWKTQVGVFDLGRHLPVRACLRRLGSVRGKPGLSRRAGRGRVLVRHRLRCSGEQKL